MKKKKRKEKKKKEKKRKGVIMDVSERVIISNFSIFLLLA